jgi:hypothetical protein
MGILDFFIGGNPLVAAKSTIDIFFEGLNLYGSYERAYRYTYIFRNNTITKYIKYPRDVLVAQMFQDGSILNCTDITVANLHTGAAPQNHPYSWTYDDFNKKISGYLRKGNIPERYVSGDNFSCIAHIADFLSTIPIVLPEIREDLILID